MAAQPFIDLSTLDLARRVATRDRIYELLPHRYEFMLLDGVVHHDPQAQLMVGIYEARNDAFWVRGHIPGRPLMPGVLMIESAAQLLAYWAKLLMPGEHFFGFGGVDAVKFRDTVQPPASLYFIERLIEARPRRVIADAQGIVNGKLAFEARITGMVV